MSLTVDQYPAGLPQVVVDWLLGDYECRACEVLVMCDANYVRDDETVLATTWAVKLIESESVGPDDCLMEWSHIGAGTTFREACNNALADVHDIHTLPWEVA